MQNIAKLIQENKRFLITTHAVPDGDGLGSEMAMHGYLQSVGKQSHVINTHATHPKFHLVDPRHQIQVYGVGDALPKADVVLVFDTSEPQMLGVLEKPIFALGVPVIFVDHHLSGMGHREGHLIDDSFGSTGELVYSLLKHMGATVTEEMALAVYVAIVTDSGSFRFRRTTARSHEIAAELLQKKVSPEEVYEHIYARDSFAKIRLFGSVLEDIQCSEDERIAWLTITKERRQYYKATIEDTEAFVNQLTLMANVSIGILFREEDDGRIKVSIRGRSEIPVFDIAQKFGGGGHRFAAGMKVTNTLEETIRLVYEEARLVLEKSDAAV